MSPESWSQLVRHSPLGILTDLDGTLLPFAGTPEEARPGPELIGLLERIGALPDVTLAVVSGRTRTDLEAFFGESPHLVLMAEHGAWRRTGGEFLPAVSLDATPMGPLCAELVRTAERYPGALVERKTWSVALHFRRVATLDKPVLQVHASALIAPWLEQHPEFERLDGSEVIEVRPVRARKSEAVAWMKEQAGAAARLLALGDDVTDEDMFAALRPCDEAILVGRAHGRATSARHRLDEPASALDFLRWLLSEREGSAAPPTVVLPEPIDTPHGHAASAHRLLVISNRLPELPSPGGSGGSPGESRTRNVGGLVSALEPVLLAGQGVWLGWSGQALAQTDGTQLGFDESGVPALAWVDLSESWHRHYYNGLCNSALWPLFHSFPGRVRFASSDWQAYCQVNDVFAAAAARLMGSEYPIWIHDYHLLLVGQHLRRRGHKGPIGLFLHIPFPGADVFSLFPWADELLTGMLDLDLIGFHTPGYVDNFRQCAAMVLGAQIEEGGQAIVHRGRRTRIGAFPIGIIPESFQEPPDPTVAGEMADLMRSLGPTRLVLGVDRLDYTKGIRERLAAFGCLLEQNPEWRRNVSLVQISVPSRADVPEYAEQRAQIENTVGRINGEFGEAHWVPIRYLYRSYGRSQLSQLYRAAAVGYVTPLRDGMNLVAKEYVAAQDPADPGVLLLSRFAGAAVELPDAVLTNPWHIEGMAADLDRSLRMPVEERKARHERLLSVVSRTTALTWAQDFLQALVGS